MPSSRSRRRARLSLLVTFALLATIVAVVPGAFAAPGISGTFESGDGDLNSQQVTDWNDLVTDPGGPPVNLSGDGEALNYEVVFDPHNSNQDIVYRGGANHAKHDVECPGLTRKKEQNKSDFTRFGIAYETVDDDVFVYLYWIRGPQNSTTASGHASFELNQGDDPCPAQSSNPDVAAAEQANVFRTAGDLLFIYDFEGGPGQIPTITLHRWIDAAGDDSSGTTKTAAACEVANALPCWGEGSDDLVDDGHADARVNDASIGPVFDLISDSDLGVVEFGEAGINFTAAGIFPSVLTDPETDCVSFGQARVSSRASGTSFNADLKDWVEPADVTIQNCGRLTIEKVTVPAGDEDTDFDFTLVGDHDTDESFSLKDGESTDPDFLLFVGDYTVTEDDPGPLYALTDIDCDSGDFTVDVDNRNVVVNLAADDDITCTFTNERQVGALLIHKNSSKGDGTEPVANAGAEFSVAGPAPSTDSFTVVDNGTDDEDPAIGVVCVSGLLVGDYTVNETDPPNGYGGAAEGDLVATVVAGTNCTDNLPGTAGTVTFTNAPLFDIQANFRDGGSGETEIVSIVCNGNTTLDDPAATGWEASQTNEDIEFVDGGDGTMTIVCTLVIDP
jgi:hypothetical protein